jgi:hypothetical protein
MQAECERSGASLRPSRALTRGATHEYQVESVFNPQSAALATAESNVQYADADSNAGPFVGDEEDG